MPAASPKGRALTPNDHREDGRERQCSGGGGGRCREPPPPGGFECGARPEPGRIWLALPRNRTLAGQHDEAPYPDRHLSMRVRATRTAAAVLTFLGAGSPLLAQSADLDEVRRVIRAETETYYRRDAEGWKRTWVQDSTAIRTFITSGSYSVALGWDRFGPGTVESLRKDPTPQAAQVTWSNFVARIDGALAWAEYDERTTMPTDSVPLLARQQRTLVKRDGEWRILSAGSFVGSSYGASPDAVESRLESIGADLMSARKHRDAIEVLELNAKLFPRASSAHQRLGAAYAAAGDTGSAMRSYERSVEIDPRNDASRSALAALRGKKTP